ncbi:MAG: c-type cytochrome biogenesis protein CcmI [Pseudomonadota bacterium]
MIWLVLLICAGCVGAYLLYPFFASNAEADPEGLEEARRQRSTVDRDEAEGRLDPLAADQAREALDRRILALLDQPAARVDRAKMKTLALALVPAVLVLGAVGIYAQTGSPNYQPLTLAEYRAQQVADLPDSLEGLVGELKARLDSDPNPPAEGFVLLARSYLRLGRAEDALAAYDQAVERSQYPAPIAAERERVATAIQVQGAAPAIDPETRAQIEAMSADEQAAMIESMVEGLAARLAQDPNDIQGWMRLIRARMVMGQPDQALADLTMAQSVFADQPEESEALRALAQDLVEQMQASPP